LKIFSCLENIRRRQGVYLPLAAPSATRAMAGQAEGKKEYSSSLCEKLDFLCVLCGWTFRKRGKRLGGYLPIKKNMFF
jgi:hypothetical protein